MGKGLVIEMVSSRCGAIVLGVAEKYKRKIDADLMCTEPPRVMTGIWLDKFGGNTL